MLSEGGYTMIGIILASLAALTEIIYCFIVLRRRIVLSPKLIAVAKGEGEASEHSRAELICEKQGGPFARILLAALDTRDCSRQEAEEMVEGAGRRAAHMLSRGVMVLEVVAAIAPLLGLLGTVIGMQDAFAHIAQQGVKNIGELPGGISKALITTITGLIVAIPAYVFYSYFQRRVDDLVIEMERYALHMLSRLHGEE
jgi:biopolymer transport protein ExbB